MGSVWALELLLSPLNGSTSACMSSARGVVAVDRGERRKIPFCPFVSASLFRFFLIHNELELPPQTILPRLWTGLLRDIVERAYGQSARGKYMVGDSSHGIFWSTQEVHG